MSEFLHHLLMSLAFVYYVVSVRDLLLHGWDARFMSYLMGAVGTVAFLGTYFPAALP